MKIKHITIGASRTINLGNYNSMRVEGSCTVEFDDDETDVFDVSQARALALDEVRTQMAVAYDELKPKKP